MSSKGEVFFYGCVQDSIETRVRVGLSWSVWSGLSSAEGGREMTLRESFPFLG